MANIHSIAALQKEVLGGCAVRPGSLRRLLVVRTPEHGSCGGGHTARPAEPPGLQSPLPAPTEGGPPGTCRRRRVWMWWPAS